MKVRPWSPSSLDNFKSCPRKFYEETYNKVGQDQPETEAQIWGTRVHTYFEEHQRDGTPLPDILMRHQPFMDEIREGRLIGVERKYGITTSLKPCSWDAPDIWHRGIIDLHRDLGNKRCRIVDYKSGKEHSKMEQLQCYAIYALLEGYAEVEVMYYWTQSRAARPRVTYKADRLYPLIRGFAKTLEQYVEAHKDNIWQPRQNGLCNGWCPVKECEYWNPRS